MLRLGDYITEENHPFGESGGTDDFALIGVSNELGLHPSTRTPSADTSNYKRVEKDWFAYNPMRINVGSIGLADSESNTGYTSPDYVVFSCRNGLEPLLLLYFLKSEVGLEAIARNCSGAVRKRLYYSNLAQIELPLRRIEDQQEVIERIRSIREIQIEIEHSRTQANDLLQAVLKEAFAPEPT